MDTITITVAENDPDVVVNATLNEDAVTITINEAAVGATGPAGADGGTSDVKSASFTAANDKQYTAVATLTVTDPSPVEGKGFEVFLRNGTATVGGTAYTRSGTTIRRVYHSGAWTNTAYVFPIVSADISDATSAATANKVVIRDASGGAAFDDLTAATVVSSSRIYTTANSAEIRTDGNLSHIFTVGADSYIYTQGANASISTGGAAAKIYTLGSGGNIETRHANASVKSYGFAAYDATAGAALVDSSGTLIATFGSAGQNFRFDSGTEIIFGNSTVFTYDGLADAAHRTALGLTALATTTPGTGVATALAVNVGTAGAFVVHGGALGTPSSGTLTSCTGLPISTGVSGLGTGVATLLTGTPSGTGGPVGTTSPTITTPTFTRSGNGTIITASESSRTITCGTASYGVELVLTTATGLQGAYGTFSGMLEAFVAVNASSNTSGQRWMRFGNKANRFSIQRLTDSGAALTATPFSFANDAPENAFYMNSSGGVTLGATTDAGAGNLLLAGTITTVGPASSTARPMKFGSVTSITDASMVALGFTSQQKVEINAVAYWIPMKTSAWT